MGDDEASELCSALDHYSAVLLRMFAQLATLRAVALNNMTLPTGPNASNTTNEASAAHGGGRHQHTVA